MHSTIDKKERRRLFDNKFYTYLVADQNGNGQLVEVELTVCGKDIKYTYTKVRERDHR